MLDLTGLIALPNSKLYSVCTTLQYNGYKPAANATTLMVSPQSTEEFTITKTAEEMQEQAEQEGWLEPPQPRFSWLYPWFRLHFIAVVANEHVLDVGLSILGCDIVSIFSPFNSWLEDAIRDLITYPITKAYFVGWILSEITLFASMYGRPWGFLGGLILSVGIKELFFQTASDSDLKGSFLGALFSWAYGFLDALRQIVNLGITALSDFLQIGALNFWKLAYKFIYIPINMIYLVRIILRLVELGIW